jgi:PTH1 family peptidyl-tRNA hydrolase
LELEVPVENLYLIAGLGNPGREYSETRHNAGFMVVDRFAERRAAVWKPEEKFQARAARVEFEGRRLVLFEPWTFMNSSGAAVQAIGAYFRIPVGNLLVVVDDADLTLGELRMRDSGRSGGHHGLESIEKHLGTREYLRMRVGIGRRVDGVREITNYVLRRFERGDRPLLEAVLERACDQIECWLRLGRQRAMNDYNGMINSSLVKES